MFLYRVFMVGALTYLGYKVIRFFGGKGGSDPVVKGERKAKPLDLHGTEIEDAEYEDIKEKTDKK